MKNENIISEKLTSAMSDFIKQLPDAERSFHSTIMDEILLDHKKITFRAQKTKGRKGMCWNINYKASAG